MANVPAGDTGEVFISFSNTNISSILKVLVPEGRGTRDKIYFMNGGSCSDFRFLLGNICPFRGEENAPQNENSGATLVKMAWAYDSAPYFLGNVFTLHTIHILL